MAQEEIKELSSLPLELLIGTPLNAAIKAQTSAALATAEFVKSVGFTKPGLFAPKGGDVSDVRVATLKYKIKELTGSPARPEVVADPTATPPVVAVAAVPSTLKVEEKTRELSLPFLSMVTIPALEVEEVLIDFNVRLESVKSRELDFSLDNTTTTTGSGSAGADLGSLGIPVSVGASMSVQSTTQTKFGAKYGEAHTSEYNLHITVKARQAAPPKGIDKLLALAEKIVDASERAPAELARLTATP